MVSIRFVLTLSKTLIVMSHIRTNPNRSLSSFSAMSSSTKHSSSISSRNQNKKWCFVFVGSKCRFTGWFDGPMCAHSRAIIPRLLSSINKLKSQKTRLKSISKTDLPENTTIMPGSNIY
uniref:Uncharacterized protein n=1 Tax=Lactuca sativa TaxID=4236 RepID=A0A9R1UP95_LACSA|nr:hypothetical protein LSAT_V11C800388890 [Lactuca sativa]